MSESIALFGPQHTLLGILTEPPAGVEPRNLGVVILGAGMVHRAGPHRLHVRIARELAAEGYRVARFDFSGIGDSPVRRDNLPLEQAAVSETREVMDQLALLWGVERFVLLGICSGASVAFVSMTDDPLVAGSVMINPRAFGPSREYATLVREQGLRQFYWTQGIRDPRRWRRLLTGKAAYGKIARSLRGLFRQATGGTRELLEAESTRVVERIRTVATRGGGILFLFSAGDPGLEQFKVVMGKHYSDLTSTGPVRQVIVEQTDHTFSLQRSQKELLGLVRNWLSEITSLTELSAPSGKPAVAGIQREEQNEPGP